MNSRFRFHLCLAIVPRDELRRTCKGRLLSFDIVCALSSLDLSRYFLSVSMQPSKADLYHILKTMLTSAGSVN